MSTKTLKIKIFVISGIIGIGVAYLLTWSYQGLILGETTLSNEDSKSLDDCTSLADKVAVKFSVNHSESYPHSKGIYCTSKLSFLFKKYRELTVYGVLESEKQKELVQFIKEHNGAGKPIALKIYEKEVWVSNSADSAHRDDEKLVSKYWID